MRAGIFWLGVAIILAGIVHIAAMLVIPILAPNSGYSRFERSLAANTVAVLGPAEPGSEPFPFASPDAIYVVCRYDISQAPLRITAALPETFWSLALYEPDGGNFYVTDSMQSVAGQPDLLVHTRGQAAANREDTISAETTVSRGLAVLRIFLRDPTMAPGVRQAALRTSCVPVPT